MHDFITCRAKCQFIFFNNQNEEYFLISSNYVGNKQQRTFFSIHENKVLILKVNFIRIIVYIIIEEIIFS